MKKEHVKPTIEIIEIDTQDIITTSGFAEKEGINELPINDEPSTETPIIKTQQS